MRYALLWRPTLLRWGGCCTAAQPNEAVWVCSLLARLQRQASGCSWRCACVSLSACMSCSSPLSTCTELLGAQGKLPASAISGLHAGMLQCFLPAQVAACPAAHPNPNAAPCRARRGALHPCSWVTLS